MAKPTKLKNGKWRIRYQDQYGKRKSSVLDTFKDASFCLNNFQSEAEKVRRGLKVGIAENPRRLITLKKFIY